MDAVGRSVSTFTKGRCPECGRLAVTAGACSACGQIAPVLKEFEALANVGVSPLLTAPLPPRVEIIETVSRNDHEVRGRVLIVRQAANEPMDFDPWRWVAIPTWGLVLLLSPFVAGIIAWQTAGFLAATGVLLGAVIVLRFIFSDRLIQSWHLAAALNGRHVVELMPVAMVRLRAADGRELQLRLKGQILGGAVMEGDRIAALGAWRAGVFRVRRIHCERTGAAIVPRQPCARGLALAGLAVLAAGALWLGAVGVPWARSEAEIYRESFHRRMPVIQPIHFDR
jgi:hypothetical protein